jgi:glycosyltransferase involved in cell wall biosynthesis
MKHPVLKEEELLNRIVVNPLGVETNYFNPEKRTLIRESKRENFLKDRELPRNALLFGSVGRIHPQKDPQKAVALFDLAHEKAGRPSNWYLVLIGPYPRNEHGAAAGYALETLEHARENHPQIIDRIIMPGSMCPLEGNSLLDIGIESSKFETWGLAFQERLASGVPTISRPNEVYEELYTNSGLHFIENDDEFADKLVALASNDVFRREYAEICTKAGQRYSWQNSVQSLRNNIFSRFS